MGDSGTKLKKRSSLAIAKIEKEKQIVLMEQQLREEEEARRLGLPLKSKEDLTSAKKKDTRSSRRKMQSAPAVYSKYINYRNGAELLFL